MQHAKDTTEPELLLEQVSVARCAPAYLEGTSKVSFSVQKQLQPVLDALLHALQATGGIRKFGAPPRTGYERTVEKLLVDLGEWTTSPSIS